jgi:hypothetical protein
MKKSAKGPTQAEKLGAQHLFARAVQAGTLKPPRALAALRTHSGLAMAVSLSKTTWHDYLPEARAELLRRKRPPRR